MNPFNLVLEVGSNRPVARRTSIPYDRMKFKTVLHRIIIEPYTQSIGHRIANKQDDLVTAFGNVCHTSR